MYHLTGLPLPRHPTLAVDLIGSSLLQTLLTPGREWRVNVNFPQLERHRHGVAGSLGEMFMDSMRTMGVPNPNIPCVLLHTFFHPTQSPLAELHQFNIYNSDPTHIYKAKAAILRYGYVPEFPDSQSYAMKDTGTAHWLPASELIN